MCVYKHGATKEVQCQGLNPVRVKVGQSVKGDQEQKEPEKELG